VARLLVAEQVAGAADLQVAHRDAKSSAQLGVVDSAASRCAASAVSAAALGYSR